MNVIVYAIPVFLVMMAGEFALGVFRGRNVYRLNDAVGSLSAGILSQISAVFLLALSVGVYALVHARFALLDLRADDWRVWVAALVAYDFLYYWNHRIDHEVGIFWAAHVVHHQSDRFNLTTALRQTSTGSLLGWVFYLPMAVAGVPPAVFVGVGLIDLLYQFWIHTELVGKLGWFDRVFASPSNHRVHHGINDQYLDKNYGGILILWDRLFGTFEEEVEKPVFGVRGGLGAFDPISANWAYYATMAKLARGAGDWRDKLRVLVKPPGWVPPDMRAPAPQAPFDLAAVKPFDPPASRSAKVLACAALVAMIGATAGFLVAAPSLPLDMSLSLFVILAAVLWGIGALLDGRISDCEALYVFFAAVTSAAHALEWFPVEAAGAPLALIALIAAFARREGRADVKRLIAAGLVVSLVGDMVLTWLSLFPVGLAIFLIVQLLYATAFSRGVGFLPSRPAAVAVALFCAVWLVWVWAGIGADLRVPVVAYFGAIGLNVAQAAGRATVLRTGAAVAVALGAASFLLADLTIALAKFRDPGWDVDLWQLPLYYLAQGLIAFFVLPRAKESPWASAIGSQRSSASATASAPPSPTPSPARA